MNKSDLQDIADKLSGYSENGWEIIRAEKIGLDGDTADGWTITIIKHEAPANESNE